jgi:hypothetical protein
LATAWKTTVSSLSNLCTSTDVSRLRFSIALPPTLPRNGWTSTGNLLYWLVGNIEGQPGGTSRPKVNVRASISQNVDLASGSSSSSEPSATSALPAYSNAESGPSEVEWLRGSVQSERRIAISHNPNPEGGVTRLDDNFTHNLPDFGTCRIQTRVNEVGQHRLAELTTLVVYRLSLSTAVHMSCALPTCDTIRYPRETRRNSHHHTSTDRQADSHQKVVHYRRAGYDTSTVVLSSSNRLSRSLARGTSRRR